MDVGHSPNLTHTQTVPWSLLLAAALWLVGICASAASHSAPQHFYSPATPEQMQPLNTYVDYYADHSGGETISTILQQPNRFIPLQNKPLFTFPKVHWYRLPLASSRDVPTEWVVSTGVASVTVLNSYWVDDRGVYKTPALQALSQFALQTNMRIMVELPAASHGHLYIQYAGIAQFPLDIQLFTPQEYLDKRFKYTLLNGMTIGVLVVFLLFFLLQYGVYRQRYLGFYCLFIFSILLFAMQVFGYGIRFHWPTQIQLDTHATHLSAGFIYLFYFLFSAYLFPLHAAFTRTLQALALVTGLATLAGIYVELDFVLTTVVALGMPLAIAAAVKSLPQQRLTAWFFIAGSLVHYVFACLMLLMLLGVPLGRAVFGLATAGQLVDIVCFSTAILISARHTETLLNSQVQERLHDLHSLNESEQLAAQLRELNKAAVLDASTTAHDLQQVLGAIRLQLAQVPIDSALRDLLQQSVTYAAELLQQKIQKGKTSYFEFARQQPVDKILAAATLRLRTSYPTLRFQAQAKTLHCSALALNRIIDNLVVNAFKYGGTKGVLLTGRRKDGGYLLQVRDRGKGIEPDKLQRITQPFTRIAKSDIDDLGHGLGLHIVKFICDEFGYEFHVQSRPGRGTCVGVMIYDVAITGV